MGFEDEIKMTKPFESELKKAMINVIYTGNFFSDRTSKVLKEFGINDQHFNILRILKGKYPKPACPTEIREVLIDKRGDLTRLLDKLDKMDLIIRQTNELNRRMVDVVISQKGIALIKKMTSKLKRVVDDKESLTEKEATVLNRLLDKFRG